MSERLDRLFSRLGYGSRKELRRWLKEGRIEVQGVDAPTPAMRVQPDAVRIDGEALDHPHGLCVLMHKPKGLVCDRVEHLPSVFSLLPERWLRRRPVLAVAGRLDRDAEGLVVLTDDGALNHMLTHPRKGLWKTYHVRLDRALPADAGARFASGMALDGEARRCRPAQLSQVAENEAIVRLQEGRHHQIKRMFAALGCRVISLRRVAIGELRLDALSLAPGRWRVIEKEELIAHIFGHPRSDR